MTTNFELCYNIDLEDNSKVLFKAFVSHWLRSFCAGMYRVELSERRDGSLNVNMLFSNRKDFLVATIKGFPSSLSKYRVLH